MRKSIKPDLRLHITNTKTIGNHLEWSKSKEREMTASIPEWSMDIQVTTRAMVKGNKYSKREDPDTSYMTNTRSKREN